MLNIAHGKFQLSVENEILLVSLRGEVNEQCAAKYIDCFATQAEKLAHKPFGVIVDISGFRGATPAAYEICNRYNKTLLTMPSFAGKAVFCPPSMSALYHISVAQQPYVQQQVKRELQQQFHDIAGATQWLRQKIMARY
ncbi:hypothetical protein DXX93_03580 [Thalassotalea euphylliae]|uniref:STAS domain-containing protein n=2 Tax=Thalassotalea euphylliae TaxID=1655234 RepID=A0A3E0TME3_9GAMM|nr:hypothetical protein DXX93_03580 [Thalassotalea euphylliae]